MQDDDAPEVPPVDWAAMLADLLYLQDEHTPAQLRGFKFDVYKAVHLYHVKSGLRDEYERKMEDLGLPTTDEEKLAAYPFDRFQAAPWTPTGRPAALPSMCPFTGDFHDVQDLRTTRTTRDPDFCTASTPPPRCTSLTRQQLLASSKWWTARSRLSHTLQFNVICMHGRHHRCAMRN